MAVVSSTRCHRGPHGVGAAWRQVGRRRCARRADMANARPARGVRTYDYRLRTDEFGEFDGMRITTVARTGFDIARRRPLDAAIANLDALGNATGLQTPDILRIAREHRGSRGLRQLAKVLDLYDPGAASPKETWLRLLVIRNDYPRHPDSSDKRRRPPP